MQDCGQCQGWSFPCQLGACGACGVFPFCEIQSSIKRQPCSSQPGGAPQGLEVGGGLPHLQDQQAVFPTLKNPGILPPRDGFQQCTLSLFNQTCSVSVIVKDFENRNLAKLLLLHAILTEGFHKN